MKIVIPDDFPTQFKGSPELKRLESYGEVILYDNRATSEDELIERMSGAKAVINVRAYTSFNAALLDSLPELEIISISGTGTDNVDLAAATQRGIAVTNTPGASTISVAEHTFALMLAVMRNVVAMDKRIREGSWTHIYGYELHGKTLGLIGLGKIAQHVARIANAFGMKVIAWSFTQDLERAKSCGVEMVELEHLLAESDVVSLHLRASPKSQNLIGGSELSKMKPSAVLVNTARASIVDETALVEALQNGKIGGAGLDVFWNEPLRSDHPLSQMQNVVLTPHAGWVTHDANQRLIAWPVDNIINYLEGKPQNVVNPEALLKRTET